MKFRSDIFGLSILSLATTVFAIFFGIMTKSLVYEKPVLLEAVAVIAPAVVFPAFLSIEHEKLRTLQFYLSLIAISYYLLLVSALVWVPNIDLLLVISLVVNIFIFYRVAYSGRISIYKASVFLSVVFIMFYLSGLLRPDVSPSLSPPLYAGSIYDDESPAGVPAFFSGALVLYSRIFVLTISVQALALFAGLSSVLTENYSLIFRYVKGKASKNALSSSLTGVLSILSCQCEGVTAAFPTAVTLLLSVAIIPLIMESVVLLTLTNLFLLFFYIRGRRITLRSLAGIKSRWALYAMSAIFITSLPVIETVGIYFGMERNLFFFVAIDIAMFVEGVIIALIISLFINTGKLRSVTVYLLSAVSFALMFIWFIPSVSAYAYSFYFWYSVMSLTSVLAGFISGYVYRSMEPESRRVYMEFITMMFSMFAIILFYLTVEGNIVIWSGLAGIAGQTTLSIAIWVVSLPVMWIATNVSLNSYGESHAAGFKA